MTPALPRLALIFGTALLPQPFLSAQRPEALVLQSQFGLGALIFYVQGVLLANGYVLVLAVPVTFRRFAHVVIKENLL